MFLLSFKSFNIIVKLLDLVFLFIICIRFPKGKSIADRYGEAFLRKIRKFEIDDYKLRKGHLDLRFLLECKKNNLIPKYLQFKLANRNLHNSLVCKKCHTKLLEKEIKANQRRPNILEKDTKRIRKELQETLSCLDFSYICCLLLIFHIIDTSILHRDNIQKRK